MHVETALVTAPIAISLWAGQAGGIKEALQQTHKTRWRPLLYACGALVCGLLAHHGGTWLDLFAHLAGGFFLWMTLLEGIAWLPLRAHGK